MRILDLFAGIGGFSLGAHWAGLETAAFVEWNPFCQKVLAKNFPGVPIYGDITKFDYEQEKDRIGPVDIVCGGPPCQGYSKAGKRLGEKDPRDGWGDAIRILGETGAGICLFENVYRFANVALDSVCNELESMGFEIRSYIIPANATGALIKRDRVWIVGLKANAKHPIANSLGSYRAKKHINREAELRHKQIRFPGSVVPESIRNGTTPGIFRLSNGIPSRMDKRRRVSMIRGYGNAVVPQIPYIFFEAIKAIKENSK